MNSSRSDKTFFMLLVSSAAALAQIFMPYVAAQLLFCEEFLSLKLASLTIGS